MRARDFLALANEAESGDLRSLGRAIRRMVQRTIATATAVAGAATITGLTGKVTSEALVTAQNGIYTLTLTNSDIAAADVVMAEVANGTNTQGTPMIGRVQPAAGSVVIHVINKHATAEALNGTVVVTFNVIKAG